MRGVRRTSALAGALCGVALLLAGLEGAQAACPRSCSGHGTCTPTERCECFPGFTGVDCSQRTCSQGTTWFGRLSSVADFGLDAHRASECSGAGLCDRATGNCACFDGFEGAACDRVACARKCNSRGVCLTSQQLGLQYGQDTTPGVRGDGAGPVYGDTTTTLGALVWDEHVTQTCVCDLGFSGPDCGEAYCPAGDNPFTEFQQRRAVKLTIDLNGGAVANDGTQLGYIQFAGQVSAPLNFGALSTATGQDFVDWFDSLANIFSTRVRVTKTGAGSALVVVVDAVLEFESRRAVWNNLFVFNGNPPLSMFSCDLGSVDDASVLCGFTDIDVMTVTHAKDDPSNNLIRIRVTDASTDPNMFAYTIGLGTESAPLAMSTSAITLAPLASTILFATTWGHTFGAIWTIAADGSVVPPSYAEFDQCGGVGLCQRGSQTCVCHEDATGSACHMRAVTPSDASGLPLLTLLAKSSTYKGDVLRLETVRQQSSEFNFLTAVDDNRSPIFTLHGNGRLNARMGSMREGLTVEAGGLNVENGGGTIAMGGLAMGTGDLTIASGDVEFQSGTLDVSYDDWASTPVVGIHATSPVYTGSIVSVTTDAVFPQSTVSLFESTMNGAATPIFDVVGNGRVRVFEGPLEVLAGGADITGGLSVQTGGLTIEGGLRLASDSDSVDGLVMTGTSAAFTADLVQLDSGTAAGAGFNILAATSAGTPVFSVRGDGRIRAHTGGLLIDAGGATIASGGLEVTAGGLFTNSLDVVTGPSTLVGDLSVTGEASVSSVTNTLLVTASGPAAAEALVTVESTGAAAGAFLITAGVTTATVYASKFSVDDAGNTALTGTLTAGGDITGSIGKTTPSEGRFNPLVYRLPILRADVVLTSLGGNAVTLTTADCGKVVSTSSDRNTIFIGHVVITLPDMTNAAGVNSCQFTFILRSDDNSVFIRNPAGVLGKLRGKALVTNMGASTVTPVDLRTNAFGSQTGEQQLTYTGDFDTAENTDDGSVLTIVSETSTENGQWYVTHAVGAWSLTTV